MQVNAWAIEVAAPTWRVVALVYSGTALRQVASSFPGRFIRHHEGIERSGASLKGHGTRFGKCLCTGAPHGKGKFTPRSSRGGGGPLCVASPNRRKWFDEYDRHETVLFEEFRGQLSWGFSSPSRIALTEGYFSREDPSSSRQGICHMLRASAVLVTTYSSS